MLQHISNGEYFYIDGEILFELQLNGTTSSGDINIGCDILRYFPSSKIDIFIMENYLIFKFGLN